MSGRGIFTKQNGKWVAVSAPTVNQSGAWDKIKAGFTKVNGTWAQFWPPNVRARILVVAGGGGGGIGYGYEGGGGGGAGGLVFAKDILLDGRNIYNAIVGAGGGANSSGSNSYFGLNTTLPSTSAVDTAVYPASYPVYNGFLNTYGVWTSPDFVSPVGSPVTVNYTANIPVAQSYTLTVSADNHVTVTVAGQSVTNDGWWTTDSGVVNLPAGLVTITCTALNDGGPASFAAALYSPDGSLVWNTRMVDPIQVDDGWFTAIGGGNGGWGTPSQTAGSGGSGGGGCGYVNTHSGGNGTPGQGYAGGTGIWQGFGQAGGGGGGGFSGPGAQSNGNQGGSGGNGISLAFFSQDPTFANLYIAGGGGGGYGNQGPGGSGPPGEGGLGGGGIGNGGDALPNTGGGGGGSGHSNYTPAGTGGSGLVAIQYEAVGAFFAGGNITVNNGIVTHMFTGVGSSTLSPN